MVADKIENLHRYKSLHSRFDKAFEFIKNTDFNTLEIGRHPIDGDDIFGLWMEYETKNKSECLLEAHQIYIDIQYVIEGEENFGIIALRNQIPSVPYDTEKDIAFFAEAPDSMVKVSAGNFVILFPEDMHMPSLTTDKIRKVKKLVIKVRLAE